MKKSLRSLLAFLIAATVLCCIAMADTGPKPSASFTFTGMPDEDYYVTMLAEVDAYGPHRVHQPGSEIPGYVLEQGEQDPAYPAWQKFVDYKDPDGYYFLEDLFEQCHGDDEAGWRYFPPEQFKLLLYFPESDTFLCSTVTERYAFDSVYRLDLGGKSPAEVAALTLTDPNGDPLPTGTVTLDKADGTHQQIVGFFGRLGITLVIELALAWGWKYRKGSQLLFIGVANLVTQCLLNASPRKFGLVVGAEALSKVVDWTDRGTCILFGDGAAAAVVECREGWPSIGAVLGSRGDDILLRLPGLGRGAPNVLSMEGTQVFKFAVETVPACMDATLKKAGLTPADIDFFVFHQANARIIDLAVRKYRIPPEKYYKNIDRYGNTAAASVPLVLSELVEQGRVGPGSRLLLTAFGGGLTWGGAVLEMA